MAINQSCGHALLFLLVKRWALPHTAQKIDSGNLCAAKKNMVPAIAVWMKISLQLLFCWHTTIYQTKAKGFSYKRVYLVPHLTHWLQCRISTVRGAVLTPEWSDRLSFFRKNHGAAHSHFSSKCPSRHRSNLKQLLRNNRRRCYIRLLRTTIKLILYSAAIVTMRKHVKQCSQWGPICLHAAGRKKIMSKGRARLGRNSDSNVWLFSS